MPGVKLPTAEPPRVYVAPDGSATLRDTGEPCGLLVPIEDDRCDLMPWPLPGEPPPGFYSAASEGAAFLASKDRR